MSNRQPKMLLKCCLAAMLLLCLSSQGLAQDWEGLALEKSKRLRGLVRLAQSRGVPVDREKMTLNTADVFLKYARWDEAHIVENQRYFSYVPPFTKDAEKLARDLPTLERRDVCDILDRAIIEIQAVLAGEVSRAYGPKLDFTKVKRQGEVLWQGDRPVFVADYTWKPATPELSVYYGALNGAYIDASHVLDRSGRIKSSIIQRLEQQTSEEIGYVFLGHMNIPGWAREEYDKLIAGQRHFTKYDIDHPGTREMLSLLFKGTVPLMAGRRFTQLGYMLANEPHWFTAEESWDTGPVSDYARQKFKVWLRERHTTISDLNALWGSRFRRFEEVDIDIPMANSLQGTAQWYDWMSFNNHRVTEWFSFLKTEIQKYDPDALVHIKVMPELWSENKKDHGLDFEQLLRLQGIIGCDAKASYSDFYKDNKPWMDRYAFKWRNLCMPFDFFKSVQPRHLIFDTETHFLSAVHFRELDLSPAYARATYWLAHLHGLNASQTWVWGRDSSGAIAGRMEAGYAGSVAQQPRIVNEVALTMMDLNAFSKEITAIQQQKKPIRIYYSLASAINNKTYMDALYEAYQSLYFEGLPLGFATEGIIRGEPHSDWGVILIRKTEQITARELNTVQSYLDHGGTVLIDDSSFKSDEYGRTHKTQLQQSKGRLIRLSSLEQMTQRALSLLHRRNALPEVSLTETNPIGLKGCVWRAIKNTQDKHIVTIVNIGKSQATLQISPKPTTQNITCTNLFTGQTISRVFRLEPYGVMLLEINNTLVPKTNE